MFSRRNKVIDYFSLMLRKRLRNEEDGELDEEETKAKRGNSKKSKGIFTNLYLYSYIYIRPSCCSTFSVFDKCHFGSYIYDFIFHLDSLKCLSFQCVCINF